MPLEKREIYNSSNGDRWFLARDREAKHVFIRHEANVPSGGQLTDIDIGEFLGEGRRNPEHQALLHLIAEHFLTAATMGREIRSSRERNVSTTNRLLIPAHAVVSPDDIVNSGVPHASAISHAEPEGPSARCATEDEQ